MPPRFNDTSNAPRSRSSATSAGATDRQGFWFVVGVGLGDGDDSLPPEQAATTMAHTNAGAHETLARNDMSFKAKYTKSRSACTRFQTVVIRKTSVRQEVAQEGVPRHHVIGCPAD
jgi:hypothetical protein